jgi:hypothetical protein
MLNVKMIARHGSSSPFSDCRLHALSLSALTQVTRHGSYSCFPETIAFSPPFIQKVLAQSCVTSVSNVIHDRPLRMARGNVR